MLSYRLFFKVILVMRNLILVFILFICPFPLFAQTTSYKTSPVTASLTGFIKDSLSGQPLEKASITLMGQVKFSTLTDNQGQFVFKNIPTGDYSLTVAFIGYSNYYQPGLLVEKKLDLGTLFLSPQTAILGKAVVTACRRLLRY